MSSVKEIESAVAHLSPQDLALFRTLIIGARNEKQLRDNLGAIGWNLTAGQMKRLDAVSAVPPIYPYWHQKGFPERNPFPTA